MCSGCQISLYRGCSKLLWMPSRDITELGTAHGNERIWLPSSPTFYFNKYIRRQLVPHFVPRWEAHLFGPSTGELGSASGSRPAGWGGSAHSVLRPKSQGPDGQYLSRSPGDQARFSDWALRRFRVGWSRAIVSQGTHPLPDPSHGQAGCSAEQKVPAAQRRGGVARLRGPQPGGTLPGPGRALGQVWSGRGARRTGETAPERPLVAAAGKAGARVPRDAAGRGRRQPGFPPARGVSR